MKTCGHCGTVNSSDAIICEKCAEILSVISDALPSEHETEQSVQPAEDTLPAEAETSQAPPASAPVTSDAPPEASGIAAPHTKGVGKKVYIIICCAVIAAAVVTVILFVFVFKTNKDKIIGTWRCEETGVLWSFNKDGTAEIGGVKSNYTVHDDALTIDAFSTFKGSENQGGMTIKKITDDSMVIIEQRPDYFSSVSTNKLISVEQTFTRIKDEKAVKAERNNAALTLANANARLIYLTLQSEAEKLKAKGEPVEEILMNRPVAVTTLADSEHPLLNAVYKMMLDGGTQLGYVYIEFDPNSESEDGKQGFVQWAEDEEPLITGQFPDPPQDSDSCPSLGSPRNENISTYADQ